MACQAATLGWHPLVLPRSEAITDCSLVPCLWPPCSIWIGAFVFTWCVRSSCPSHAHAAGAVGAVELVGRGAGGWRRALARRPSAQPLRALLRWPQHFVHHSHTHTSPSPLGHCVPPPLHAAAVLQGICTGDEAVPALARHTRPPGQARLQRQQTQHTRAHNRLSSPLHTQSVNHTNNRPSPRGRSRERASCCAWEKAQLAVWTPIVGGGDDDLLLQTTNLLRVSFNIKNKKGLPVRASTQYTRQSLPCPAADQHAHQPRPPRPLQAFTRAQ